MDHDLARLHPTAAQLDTASHTALAPARQVRSAGGELCAFPGAVLTRM